VDVLDRDLGRRKDVIGKSLHEANRTLKH
jgi:hypothetical protein